MAIHIEDFVVENRSIRVAAKRVPNQRSRYEVSVFEYVEGRLVGLAEHLPVWRDTSFTTAWEWRTEQGGFSTRYSALHSLARAAVRNSRQEA